MPDDNLTHSLDTHVFVQFGSGRETFYLGDCTVLPSLPSPSPDRRPVHSSIGARSYEQIGFEPGAPSSPTLTITTFVAGAAHYLERVKEGGCPFNLYVLTARCAASQAFNNYERAWVYRDCEFTDDPVENAVMAEEDKLTEHVFNIVAGGERVDHRPVTITRQAVSQTGDGMGLGVFPPRCATDCEEAVAACQEAVVGAGSVGGAIPDIYYTPDGLAWSTQASQFVVATDITAVETFQDLDGDYAILAMRSGLAGNPLRCEVGVIGASIVLDIGANANESVVRDSALFILDARHIWVCTDAGRVYFSSDGALTWAEQTSALTASGGNQLWATHFADALVGYAVGTSDTIIATIDGGETWTAATATGSGDSLIDVQVFGRQRLLVATLGDVSDNALYMSYNATATWTIVTNGLDMLATDRVYSLTFLDDGLTGYLVKNTAVPVGHVYKTLNGGLDWRLIETPTSDFLQSILICQPNLGWTVGNTVGGTTFIAKISG